MRFFSGFIIAILVVFVAAAIVAATYNVAASEPETAIERDILHSIMRNSVQMRAATAEPSTYTDDQIRKGFQEYDEMCIICHAAPGKERGFISKGLRPQPPLLAKAAKEWTDAQLFWIVKNGVKMTGMPAFGLTHSDDTIWNIVGFVRRLPQMTPDEFRAMESKYKGAEHDEGGNGRH
jgi:mono/diheme cytochrome c family protein